MAVLTKDHILNVVDRKVERVFCPDWGGEVLIQTMTGLDRDDLEGERIMNKGSDASVNMRNFRAALVAKCTVDEQGRRLFSDADAEQLGQKSALMLDLIFESASRLNGLRAADVEKLTKNSASGQDASSTSTSPSVSAAV